MCGIVGYVGTRNAAPILIEGLHRLEYRGYDSAGIAVLGTGGTKTVRAVGRVRELETAMPKRLAGKVGIGHTRWATHGPASEANAHPHRSMDGRISVVHNGIIDNAAALRTRLGDQGIVFTSDTDTETLAHLVSLSKAETLEDAVLDALTHVVGTYAIAVIDENHPDRVVCARNGSPLIIGVGDDEMFIGSDVSALVRHTSSVVHLEDGELAVVTPNGFRTFSKDSADTGRTPVEVDASFEDLELGGHANFMHKEIHEQADVAAAVLRGRLDEQFGTARLDGLNLTARELRSFKRIKILGCGSAYYVGQLGAQLIEDLARIPADAEAASEFRYRNPIIEEDTLYVVVSQSGETADTAFAVREIQRKGGCVLGLVNVVGSSIAREVNGGIYLHAGPEIAVASTKALTAMSIAFAMLALHIGRLHDLSILEGRRIVAGLRQLPEQISEILASEGLMAEVAKDLDAAASAFYIGRVRGFAVAREGAQKLKEISYIHAEAYQTSELKHGPLALIEESMPTVAIVPDDDLKERNLAALEQVRARGGRFIAITHPEVDFGAVEGAVIRVPKNETELDPILLTIPTQFLAYYAAQSRGLDIDKPRNLAKAVTVE